MLNTKSVELLSTLTKKEWLNFRKYLNSKSKGGKQNQLITIFDYISPLRKTLDAPNLRLDALYDQLGSPKQTKKEFQNQVYRLLKHLEDFLVIQKILSKDAAFEKDKLLLTVLKERGLEEEFYKRTQKLRQKLMKAPKGRWYHLQQLELYDLEYLHPSTPKIMKRESPLQSIMRELELLNHTLKIRYGAELLSRNHILNEDNATIEIENTIKKQRQENEEISEYYTLFSNVFLMILNDEEQSFIALKSQFEKDHKKISIDEQRAIHSYLVNYCIQQVQKNNLKYVDTLTKLYDIGFSYEILSDQNSMASIRFCNLVDLFVKSGEIERAEQFIENHSSSLHSSFQKETLVIANSIISFQRKDYSQVRQTLTSFKSFSLPHNNLRSRWLQLCSLFEEDEPVLLEDYVKATKEFLRRNKHLGETHKNGTSNLIKMIKLLEAKKLQKKGLSKEKLLVELNKMDSIYFKAWILNKIEEI